MSAIHLHPNFHYLGILHSTSNLMYLYVNYYSLFQPLIDLSSTTEINQFIKQSNVSAFIPRPSLGIIQDKIISECMCLNTIARASIRWRHQARCRVFWPIRLIAERNGQVWLSISTLSVSSLLHLCWSFIVHLLVVCVQILSVIEDHLAPCFLVVDDKSINGWNSE